MGFLMFLTRPAFTKKGVKSGNIVAKMLQITTKGLKDCLS